MGCYPRGFAGDTWCYLLISSLKCSRSGWCCSRGKRRAEVCSWKMFQLQSCCGVCSLRWGVLFIGVLFGSLGVHQTHYNAKLILQDLRNPELLRSHELTAEHQWTLFHAGLASVGVLLNVCLLLGVIFEKPWLVVPWLVVQAAATGVCGALLLGYAVFVVFINFSLGLLVMLVSAAFVVVHGYCIVVVFSYFHSISGISTHRYLALLHV